MKLADLRRHWEELGRTDPLWAILNRRDLALEDFFASGEAEIDAVMARLEELGLRVERGACLDFGCGMGRLTQALARHFDLAVGVDIASAMIEQARRHNRLGDRCRFLVNEGEDLRQFPDASFDFVYTRLVLQHMEPGYAIGYISEFLRVLRPGGVAVFQVPSHYDPMAETWPPLPEEAFRARLEVRSAPSQLEAGSKGRVEVVVANASPVPWPGADAGGGTRLRIGNHWVDAQGRMVVRDDARAAVTRPLAPGETTTVTLEVTAPPRGGRYRLEVDVVEEGVSWFADRGSPTAVAEVRVLPRRLRRLCRRLLAWRDPTVVPLGFVPTIELYGVPRATVEGVVAAAGGEVVEVADDPCVGSGWVSYRYVVRKSAVGSQVSGTSPRRDPSVGQTAAHVEDRFGPDAPTPGPGRATRTVR